MCHTFNGKRIQITNTQRTITSIIYYLFAICSKSSSYLERLLFFFAPCRLCCLKTFTVLLF